MKGSWESAMRRITHKRELRHWGSRKRGKEAEGESKKTNPERQADNLRALSPSQRGKPTLKCCVWAFLPLWSTFES